MNDMVVFEVIDNATNEVVSTEECLGNACELQMVLQEMGRDITVVQVDQGAAG